MRPDLEVTDLQVIPNDCPLGAPTCRRYSLIRQKMLMTLVQMTP